MVGTSRQPFGELGAKKQMDKRKEDSPQVSRKSEMSQSLINWRKCNPQVSLGRREGGQSTAACRKRGTSHTPKGENEVLR